MPNEFCYLNNTWHEWQIAEDGHAYCKKCEFELSHKDIEKRLNALEGMVENELKILAIKNASRETVNV